MVFMRCYCRPFIIIIIILVDVWYVGTWIYDIQNLGLQNAESQFTYYFIPEITN